jgi:SAM-dependent methyltransferase
VSEDFDDVAGSYEQLVDRSIAFAGRGHDFYLEAKAEALLELVRRRLGDPADVRALDVGCGDGLFDAHLRALGALVGVDPSGAMIERARRLNPHGEYEVADGTALPQSDGEFDLVFAVCVLHHVPPESRDTFAHELRRVTRPGGLAVVFEHNPYNPLTRLAVARCAFDEDAELLRLAETRRRLASAGLRVVDQAYVLFVPWRARRLERAVSRVPLGAQYYVAAEA